MSRWTPLFIQDPWDPTYRFQTSWLLPPFGLVLCRALIGTYILTARVFLLAWSCSHPSDDSSSSPSNDFSSDSSHPSPSPSCRSSFSYFTVLSYWALGFYFIVAALHSLDHHLHRRQPLSRLPPPARAPLQTLHSLLYSSIVTLPFLVTSVYWALLYDGEPFPSVLSTWSNVSQHALNALFAAFEILVPRTDPPPWVHLPCLVLVLAAYLALAYVTFADQGFYVYDFLDPAASPRVAAYVAGIAAAVVLIFALVWLLIWTRRWITEEKLGLNGKLALELLPGEDVEMSPVT